MNWNDRQRQAIDSKKRRLLVSAAAGSGKTAVLVERVFCRITDETDPCDISRFLIVTFTNAAAAEMRSRILARITSALAEDPDNRHLRRQMNLIHTAKITTIHSFCLSLVRENFHLLHLRPDFRLADEEETALLLEEASEQLMEEAHAQNDADFAALLDAVTRGASDRELQKLLQNAWKWLESEADRDGYIASRLAENEIAGVTDPGQTPWGRVHLSEIALQTEALIAEYRQGLAALCYAPDTDKRRNAEQTAGAELTKIEAIHDAAVRESWEDCRRALQIFDDGARKISIRSSKNLPEDVLTSLTAARADAYAWRRVMREDILPVPGDQILAELNASAPVQRAFFRLLERLGTLFEARKREANLLDFSDLEHLAVRLLAEKDESGTFRPTRFAEEKSAELAEIMVDEYQDTNGLQDLIFRMLSTHCRLFVVGDVKQSIYRFRGADPTIFLRRRQQADRDGDQQSIFLSENYRSRSEVLDATNLIFSHLMSERLGEMDYTEEEQLNCGRHNLPDERYRTELAILSLTEPSGEAPEETSEEASEEDDAVADALTREAAFVAERIRTMIDEGFPVGTGNGVETRPCRCGDFAILLRSTKNRAMVYQQALQAYGLSTEPLASESFFDTTEITALTALFRTVDNPTGGLDLPSCMASPLIGFSFDELAQIRAANRRSGSFVESLRICAEGDTPMAARAADFLTQLKTMRAAIAGLSAGDAAAYLIETTSAVAVFSAMEGGDLRAANIRRLLGMAQSYEAIGSFGDFVRYLRKLEMRQQPMRQQSAAKQSDGVRVMTIHASKGLEFPIVFLAGLSSPIRKDRKEDVVLHPTLGLGLIDCSSRDGVALTTLRREAIFDAKLSEQLSEELRLLYVAMTRAREKLILVSRLRKNQKNLRRAEEGLPPVPAAYCRNHSSLAEWVAAVAITVGGSLIQIDRTEPPMTLCAAETAASDAPTADAALCDDIRDRLAFRYPQEAACTLPAKLTATIYKRLMTEPPESAQLTIPEPAAASHTSHTVPRFCTPNRTLRPAERGTATHLAMQLLPMRAYASEDEIAEGIDTLRRRGQLTSAQAQAIRCADLLRFYQSPLGQQLTALPPERIRREFKFSILTDAARYFPTSGVGESMLLQGVIDLYFEQEDGALSILDFKTDAVTPATSPGRAAAYAPQLAIYADALAEITGRPIRSRTVYFFATGECMEV